MPGRPSLAGRERARLAEAERARLAEAERARLADLPTAASLLLLFHSGFCPFLFAPLRLMDPTHALQEAARAKVDELRLLRAVPLVWGACISATSAADGTLARAIAVQALADAKHLWPPERGPAVGSILTILRYNAIVSFLQTSDQAAAAAAAAGSRRG